MATRIDPDLYRSASLDNVLGDLSGPLAAGAQTTAVTLTNAGRLEIAWTPLRPVVLGVLKRSLNLESVTVAVTVDPGGAAKVLPPVTFKSYSETGVALPLYVPPIAAGAETVPAFTLAIQVSVTQESGAVAVLTAVQAVTYLSFSVLEGNTGKMLYLLTSEKARIRREARQAAAMKLLATARLDALDRIGADLGVPRFQDDITYDTKKGEVLTVILTDGSGLPTLEPDADYARRLGLYRPFQLSSRPRVLEILNGPGAAGDNNAGLISGLGLKSRFLAQDQDNPFALAFRIVGVGTGTPRDNFLGYVRSDILVWLPNTAAANTAHSVRYLPIAEQAEVTALRNRLQSAYTFPANAAVAPMLADTLDRLGRMLAALGFGSKPTIARAQDATAGSRYELGLGVDLKSLSNADLDSLVAAVNKVARPTTADAEAESLIVAARAMPPASSASDPDGNWLFSICGFQTVHRLDPATLYLSHLPMLGLQVDGPTSVAVGKTGDFEAHFYPADDPAINAALSAGLQAAAAQWVASGEAAWAQLTPPQQTTAWSQAIAQPSNAPSLEAFAAAGLPPIPTPAGLIASLGNVPADMLATISLNAAFGNLIRAGDPTTIPRLRNLVKILSTHGLVSAVPLVTSTNQVVVVISVLGLPRVGVNIGERRTSGFRWYAVPLGGGASVKGFGSTTTLTASAAGAVALVCLGYVRQGLADPYEVKIDLPQGATITLKEYEFLMNTLQQVYPVGVQINTYAIRQNHVDLNGDGVPEPLRPAVFKTYRAFQRRRLRGIYQDGT
jgi:hypothetical protein